MPVGLLGKKVGMTRIFDEKGRAVPVTVIKAGPCVVVQRRTKEKDGYEAVQLGFEPIPLRKVNMPMTGHFKAHGAEPMRYLKEFRLAEGEDYQEGQEITVEIFQPGQLVDVTGWTKGRGFAGVMKRWGFHGGPASHGSKVHRSPMSSGSTDPMRVFPGKKMAGHYGNERKTIQALLVMDVDPERHLLIVKGSVPGPKNGLLIIRPSVKANQKKQKSRAARTPKAAAVAASAEQKSEGEG